MYSYTNPVPYRFILSEPNHSLLYEAFMNLWHTYLLFAVLAACTLAEPAFAGGERKTEDAQNGDWISLFDGQTLERWKPSQFGGEGDVHVENGEIRFEMGVMLTGIAYQREVPKTNFEIEVITKKLEGTDFFSCVTFPVASSFASFVVGGWGGTVVGISTINGEDASENSTSSNRAFERNRWYRIRVRVLPSRLRAWIDDEMVVNEQLDGKQISIRPEVLLSKPLGICSWQTSAAIKSIRIRQLD